MDNAILIVLMVYFSFVGAFLLDNIQTVHLYVSPTGSDSYSGFDHSTPLKTIQKAVSLLSRHDLVNRNIEINLMRGYHDLTSTLKVQHTASRKVTFQAYNDEEVHVTGGKRLNNSNFHSITDQSILHRLPTFARGKVLQYRLSSSGITNLGHLSSYGFYQTRTAPLEIFYNGAPMRLARWPNEEFVNIASLVDGQHGRRFKYSGNRPNKWVHEDDLWAFGFWYWSWADKAIKIEAITTSNQTITLAKQSQYGLRVGHYASGSQHQVGYPSQGGYYRIINALAELDEPGNDHVIEYNHIHHTCMNSSDCGAVHAGQDWTFRGTIIRNNHIHHNLRFLPGADVRGIMLDDQYSSVLIDTNVFHDGGYYRIINALAELDEPGEYYVDRTSGILYFWPPSANNRIHTDDVIYVSLIDDCIDLGWQSSNIVFKGFTIEVCRRNGIRSVRSRNMTFEEMEIKNTGNFNLMCSSDCRSITIQRCYLHDGDGGISIDGGDRQTLTSSNNYINDNIIWRFSRETSVGGNALSLYGVGAHVHHNHMYIGPYTAIRWHGNDHVIEYNHIHHTCMNSSDCGAVHAGQDWTFRGTIIRNNHIHHNLRFLPGADVRGIMLDDQYSSVLIDTNVFHDNEVHVNIGGGRDNIIRNNIFYNATKYALQFDSRGTGHPRDQSLNKDLHSVPYKSSLWASRYPKLAVIDSHHPEQPIGNEIYHNIFYDTTQTEIFGLGKNTNWFNVTQNGHASSPSDFYSPNHADYRPKCHLSTFASGVNFPDPIQLSKTGPRYLVGPKYNRQTNVNTYVPSKTPGPCSTHAPATSVPHSPYLPDGSGPNVLYTVPNHGCWLHIEKCPLHTNLVSSKLFRDTDGEQHHQAAVSEAACLGRVPHYVQYCGKQSSFSVIYGPTGAMTLGGDGCFMADYGCPSHNYTHNGHAIHDTWAEQHENAANSEAACLRRAKAQYDYCGGQTDYPVTSIYRPTGHLVTAGGGCWIHIPNCPSDSHQKNMFYDSWGATNLNTDKNDHACFARAQNFWYNCGSHKEYPVTAYFRPDAISSTYP